MDNSIEPEIPNLAVELFTVEALDAIFWKVKGKGNGTLKIGGIDVTKQLHWYRSNSGKSGGFRLEFTYTDANGVFQTLVRKSKFEKNRFNDASRNWGLPE